MIKKEETMRLLRETELCKGCIFLHIGINVDHNHCDKTQENWNWMEKRANGRWEGRCHYMQRALKEEK